MAFNDPIAEFLTRLRNAQKAEHKFVDMSLSKMRKSLVEILLKQGFIEHFLIDESKKRMRIFLKYTQGRKPVMQGLKRVSSPGLRKYVGCKKIPKILGGIGIAILSTSLGLLDDRTAREQKVGGEILCYIW